MSTPYIGSKISLISKSEIRYEGILYTVDPVESTIALAKVRTFGTEERTTEHPTPARDEVFEYIIFKATDIKDIVVCETPQPVPQLYGGLPYDPAIVSVSKQTTQQQAASSLPHADPQLNASASKFAAGSDSLSPLNRSISPSLDAGGSAFASKAPGAGRRESGPRVGYQQQRRDQVQRRSENDDNFGGFQSRDYNMQNQGAFRRGNTTSNGSFIRGGFFSDRQRGGYNNGGGFIPRGNSRGGGGFRDGGPRYDGDYDFETANERFQATLNNLKDEFSTKSKLDDSKEECSNEPSAVNTRGVEPKNAPAAAADDQNASYDKTKSFFDSISCEALERLEGASRSNWRRERELNQETFGQSGFRNYRYNRRGMGRAGGGRGSGGYNNRRGGYGNRY